MKIINAAEFVTRGIRPEDVIDVRTPAEYEGLHLEGSTHIPLDILQESRLPVDASDHTHYLLCASGMRARKGCGLLDGKVKGELVVIDGGIEALRQQGVTLVEGRAVISLERQVRIAAGCLVLLGVLLSPVHPGFIGISAFVGAGLVFAGVTNHCGMALLLAKMPWNRGTGSSGQGKSV